MNKAMIVMALSILLVIKISCSPLDTQNCKVEGVKTLFTIPGVYEGKITGYTHYTLIEKFSRDCMDSAAMVKMALEYSDTVKVGNPADIIMFFNSDNGFIPNEISQDMDKINKSCLVVIELDVKTKKPNNFIFYNEKGERIYWGKSWSPNEK